MRVLFVAHGPAHVPWIVPLAWACRLAGHDVCVAARPQAVSRVTGAGLVAVPVGSAAAVEEVFARPDRAPAGDWPAHVPDGWPVGPLRWDADRRVGWADKILRLAGVLAGDLVAFARHWRPDLVVYDTGAVAGRVAAAAVGVPAVGHCWGHSMGLYFNDPGAAPPAYLRLFERFGARPSFGDEVWIDPCPPAMRRGYPVPRIDMRFVAYSGPGEVPAWLRERPAGPRVCLSGGVTTPTFRVLRQTLLDAVDGLDAEVVLAVAEPEAFSGAALPANVRMVGWFPLTALLPTCLAVVHHGGSGTGMLALREGLPQVVLAPAADSPQRLWGELVQEAGAGVCVDDPAAAGPQALRDAIAAVLDRPVYGRGARRVRDEIAAMPDPAHVVGLLERCARGREADLVSLAGHSG